MLSRRSWISSTSSGERIWARRGDSQPWELALNSALPENRKLRQTTNLPVDLRSSRRRVRATQHAPDRQPSEYSCWSWRASTDGVGEKRRCGSAGVAPSRSRGATQGKAVRSSDTASWPTFHALHNRVVWRPQDGRDEHALVFCQISSSFSEGATESGTGRSEGRPEAILEAASEEATRAAIARRLKQMSGDPGPSERHSSAHRLRDAVVDLPGAQPDVDVADIGNGSRARS